MKSLADPNSVRWMFAGFFGLLLCMLPHPCLAQQDTTEKDAKLPFDVFNQPIDKAAIHFQLEKHAGLQKESQALDAVDTLRKQLRMAKTGSGISLDSLINQSLAQSGELYPHMVKSGVFLGQFYDCGHCDRSHVTAAGGVVISESGLVLTNYHVFDTRTSGTTEGYFAMTYDGKFFEVEKILAADQIADVALVQLKSNDHKFNAAPIAENRPTPMKDVHIVSHPSGEFFTLTSGQVSRYSKVQRRKGQRGRPNSAWLEVTAEFGGGSSGSGVFNAAGEVVGVVSRIHPLKRRPSKVMVDGKELTKPGYVEMIVRRCADLDSIKACFVPSKPDSPSVKAGDSEMSEVKQ